MTSSVFLLEIVGILIVHFSFSLFLFVLIFSSLHLDFLIIQWSVQSVCGALLCWGFKFPFSTFYIFSFFSSFEFIFICLPLYLNFPISALHGVLGNWDFHIFTFLYLYFCLFVFSSLCLDFPGAHNQCSALHCWDFSFPFFVFIFVSISIFVFIFVFLSIFLARNQFIALSDFH